MKNSMTFEEQTETIVEALLSNFLVEDRPIACYFRGGQYVPETRGATSPFDPVTIASQLQHIGDQYNRDLNQHIDTLAAEMLEGKVEKFGEMVESLSKEWSSHSPGLEYERAFLAVSVRLFKDLVKKIPPVATSALLAGLINGNTQVRAHIEERGGWENLEN
ncbi:PREDICTED: bcl-2-like protein 15 [Gekko japonicus]|uniref:Bcl-2-like protein 15 n=1 Tax=Gekko japonicus TaxID=146911 RepID=A0ABM1JZJ3_GEKJA|nr:PREDICTED: bcl-2-like protein 15 [Gekko japonicus]